MIWIIEIERVGPGGYVTRFARGGRLQRFATREAAQAVADQLEAQALTSVDGWTRYEVLEMPEPEYIPERDPRHGMKEYD